MILDAVFTVFSDGVAFAVGAPSHRTSPTEQSPAAARPAIVERAGHTSSLSGKEVHNVAAMRLDFLRRDELALASGLVNLGIC